jgi:hypothetical protein
MIGEEGGANRDYNNSCGASGSESDSELFK